MRPKPANSRWVWGLAALAAVVILLAILLPRTGDHPPAQQARAQAPTGQHNPEIPRGRPETGRTETPSIAGQNPELVVRSKVVEFIRNRRQVLHAFAEHLNETVPEEFDEFLALIEAGDWENARKAFEGLTRDLRNTNWLASRFAAASHAYALMQPIQEVYQVAKIAREWPAQSLLDYGQALLATLRPGMVYVGGTDPGRFIPTLLNETAPGERYVILTQNQLVDSSYLEYAQFLYRDRLTLLSEEEWQRGFNDYLHDAEKRARHDAESPEGPRQVRFGENIRLSGGRVEVSGPGALMAINEVLLQMLLAKNPDVSFALEQSYPFTSVYSNAAPLGPILELRVNDPQRALTDQTAAETAAYWQRLSATVSLDPTAPEGSPPRLAWSKLAAEQAALLLHRNYAREAEQMFQISCQLCPYNDAVPRYAEWLAAQGRRDEAVSLIEAALRAMPDTRELRTLRDWNHEVLQRVSGGKAN